MKRARALNRLTVVLGCLLAVLPATVSAHRQQDRPPAGLDSLLEAGRFLLDRSGDGVIDFINVTLVVPASPRVAEGVAAANLAARLGFEAAGLEMGIAARDDDSRRRWSQPVILIGERNALLARLADSLPVPVKGLVPGEGMALVFGPDDFFQAGGLVLAGGDDTGLLAIADYLAGRYPAIWALDGPAWSMVAEKLGGYLEKSEITYSSIRLQALAVTADRPGVARALATVELVEDDRVAVVSDTLLASKLEWSDLRRLEIEVAGPTTRRMVRLLPARPVQTRGSSTAAPRSDPDFSLSEIYTTGGLYSDSRSDLVADRTVARLSVSGPEAAPLLADWAARIGLETAGIRLPLAEIAGQDDHPQERGFPILYGLDHYRTRRLIEQGRLYGPLDEAGVGWVQFTPGGLQGRNALVVGGADEDGLEEITSWLAHRAPYLWEYGRGRFLLEEVETDVRRFFQVREAPGQAALALSKLGHWLERQPDTPWQVEVTLNLQQVPEALADVVTHRVAERFPDAATIVELNQIGFGAGEVVFDRESTFTWEVDDVREAVARHVLPVIREGSRGLIEVRLSEPPEVRRALADEIREWIGSAGGDVSRFEIRVLSAYKQGYSWLHDIVLPRLREYEPARIEITYHTLKDSEEIRWQVMAASTRWLQELYPIDAVLARALGIADSMITFTATGQADPVYRVRAYDVDGGLLLEDTFNPCYVVRPLFDHFPDYEQMRVTTGWLKAEVDGRLVADERITTDPERFWDYLQDDIYGRIIEYVMDIQQGDPSPGNAPYFDEFRVDLWISEPNYRLGIDEEVISSAEALHEDIYFHTLMLFDLIGQRYGVGNLAYPGRVLPWIHPLDEGAPPRSRITLTGKEKAQPELIVTWHRNGSEPERERYPLSSLGGQVPRLRGAWVRRGDPGLSRLLFEVAAVDSVDRFQQYRFRSSEAAVDRSFLSVPLLEEMVTSLQRMHRQGVFEDALAWDRVGEVLFRFTLQDSLPYSRLAALPRSRAPRVTGRMPPLDSSFRWGGEPIVQVQEPIGPDENLRILGRLNTFPEVTVYRAGVSFLGEEIHAMELLPSPRPRYLSQAKRNALKPTLFLSGRQHANEVSSTTHMLKLAEELVTRDRMKEYLKKVNVVLHPMANPDGARLAWEMQQSTPDFMLHAGYLGSLGVDMTSGSGSADPIYPESLVRPLLQQTWLPDIYLNLHGYPSHEWVQHFAGYSAWVRNRRNIQRSWWIPRGWFIPSFSWVEDERYPEITAAQFAILDSIAAAITGHPEVEAMNRRLYERYRKYGKQDVEGFREHFHEGMLIYMALRGRRVSGTGVSNPRITYFSATTEAPDETARGAWLELMTEAGLAHTTAVLRYLAEGQHRVEREQREYDSVIFRSVYRQKPVLPIPPE